MTLLKRVLIIVVFCSITVACGELKQQHLKSQALLSSIDTSVKGLGEQQNSASLQLQDLQEQQVDSAEQLKELESQLADLQQTIIDADLLRQNPYQPIELVTPIAPVDYSPEVADAVEQAFNDKMVIGRVEWIWVNSLSYYLKARIDSGANASILIADEVMVFERDGKKWLQIKMKLDDDGVERVSVLEKPIQRYVKVKDDDNAARRPVISLLVNVGSVSEEIDFFVTKRSNATYPIILGKNFLTDIALVDVAQKFIYPRDEKNLQATAAMFAKNRESAASKAASTPVPVASTPVPVTSTPPVKTAPSPINVPTE